MAYYFSYGANMSKRYLEKVRNISPESSYNGYLFNYKMVINLKGPNFIEPAFANICFEKDAKVEGVVHELAETDLDRIVASEGETYELVEAPVRVRNKTVLAKTLRCKESTPEELPASRRYMKILIAAAIKNKDTMINGGRCRNRKMIRINRKNEKKTHTHTHTTYA